RASSSRLRVRLGAAGRTWVQPAESEKRATARANDRVMVGPPGKECIYTYWSKKKWVRRRPLLQPPRQGGGGLEAFHEILPARLAQRGHHPALGQLPQGEGPRQGLAALLGEAHQPHPTIGPGRALHQAIALQRAQAACQ